MKKSQLSYFVIVIATFFIAKSFLHEENQPSPEVSVKTISAIAPSKAPIDLFSPSTNKVKSSKYVETSEVHINESDNDDDNGVTENIIREPYQVTFQYPTQHVFDDSQCNIKQIQTGFEPQLKKAIERLGSEYYHDSYFLSEHLELNLYAVNASTYFKEELTERIKRLHKYYLNMLGTSAERKITLNLIILPQRDDYLHHISFYSKDIDTSIGVYFGGLNLAFVDYQGSDDKALKTALHESTHVLNSHIIGRTPYMFNEGMAEFYENINTEDGAIPFNQSEHRVNKQTYPIGLFFDDEQWNYLNTGHLYYSSWLWVTFMHSKREGLGSLIYFMHKEREDPCSSLSSDDSYSIFQEAYNVFETDFNDSQQNLPPYVE